MRLAIFGGTFDPIHDAHLAIATAAREQFELDRVLLIPAAHPPHKTGRRTEAYEHRYRMVELASSGVPGLEASRLEAEGGRSYSIYTIERVRRSISPADQLFFLIGADAFAELRTWYRWPDVIKQVDFIVVTRPGHTYDAPPEAKVQELSSLSMAVSSSEIRAALAAGQRPAGLPDPVFQYIRDHGLYGFPRNG